MSNERNMQFSALGSGAAQFTGPSAEAREPLGIRALGELQAATASLFSTVDRLEARLTPVLAPQAPTNTGKHPPVVPTSPPMIGEMFALSERLRVLCDVVESITGRIEV